MSEAGNQVKTWPVWAHPVPRALARLRRDESGAGTVFALFWMMLCFLMAGFAVDGTNAWRNQQQIQQTADVAAHAGVVSLARGDDLSTVRQTAIDAIALNMPQSVFGQLIADADQDVRLVHYEPATNSVNAAGPVNAVSVTLHRDESVGNSVRTFMLRLASLATRGQVEKIAWNMQVTGVAAVLPLSGCSGSDGIYAQGQLDTTSSQYVGSEFCLYSKERVWMPQRTEFEPGAGVGMPDLVDCNGKCTDGANPGSGAAKFEANILMPDIPAMVSRASGAFVAAGDDMTPEKDAIFGDMTDHADLTPLEAVVDTAGLRLGDVVSLTEAEFESLTSIPEGLTYNVSCSGGGGGSDPAGDQEDAADDSGNNGNGNGKGGGKDKDKDNGGGGGGGGGKSGELTLDDSNGADGLKNVAIITDCKLHFGRGAAITASFIMTTNTDSSGAVSAHSQARVGASGNVCDPEERTTIMSAGRMQVPAGFSGSNVSFVVDGDIHFAGASAQGSDHYGASYYASGSVKLAAGHTFLACEEEGGPFSPAFEVIRHVAPR